MIHLNRVVPWFFTVPWVCDEFTNTSLLFRQCIVMCVCVGWGQGLVCVCVCEGAAGGQGLMCVCVCFLCLPFLSLSEQAGAVWLGYLSLLPQYSTQHRAHDMGCGPASEA